MQSNAIPIAYMYFRFRRIMQDRINTIGVNGVSKVTGVDWTTSSDYERAESYDDFTINIPSKMKVKLFRLKATCGGFTITHGIVFRRFYVNNNGNEECTKLSDTRPGTIEDCNFCPTLDCPGISKTLEKVWVR